MLSLALVAIAVAVANDQRPPAGVPGDALAKRPLAFVPNHGQVDARVRYYAQAPGFGAYFTQRGVTLDLHRGTRAAALRLRFEGASRDATLTAASRMPGHVSYLTGNRRHAGLPTYGEVRYHGVWPGIDLAFRSAGATLKYEFVVSPGADPSKIRVAYAGADSLRVDRAGALVVGTSDGALRDSRPVTRQDGRTVASGYEVSGSSYGFKLGHYDAGRPLVIDPGLAWSTFFGGIDGEFPADIGAVAVDGTGAAYVAGTSRSASLPTTPGAYDTSIGGAFDAFVSKFDAAGALVWSTYLGGAGGESALDVAVDSTGHPYLTGTTDSADYPTTPAAYDRSSGGTFITKLNATGTDLEYSTFFPDGVRALAVDAGGSLYLVGWGDAAFPVSRDAPDTTAVGAEAFVAKLNATGRSVDYGTYIGGRGDELPRDIAVDASGSAYAIGTTNSIEQFPFTPGAFDTSNEVSSAGGNAFVTRIDPNGTSFHYSTLLGTSYVDPNAISVDPSSNAYITGNGTVPTTPGAFDSGATTNDSSFVTKLNSTGTSLLYSTHLGSTPICCNPAVATTPAGLVVDSSGSAYVSGSTGRHIPLTPSAADEQVAGQSDAFVIKLNPGGSAVTYGTYLGGGNIDEGRGIALLGTNSLVVAGYTDSPDFPTTPSSYDTTYNGGGDLFITKLQTFDGYPRPKGATPLRFSLVNAFKPRSCSSSQVLQHGPPLAYSSCPPVAESPNLTLGTGDSNGNPATGIGSLTFTPVIGNPATPADEADVKVGFSMSDVFKSDLTDYAGELRLWFNVRMTDRGFADGAMGTTQDYIFPIVTPACASTADDMEGSLCVLSTTVEALIPGAIAEGKRSIWQIDDIRVWDGGADGDADTLGDNRVFARPGVFVP